MSDLLPTDDELIINAIIMGGCNHPYHTTETKREFGYDYEYLLCTNCGKKFLDMGHDDFSNRTISRPDNYLLKFVPLYSRQLILARTVVRHLEGQGWKALMRIENGKYQYSFTKGELRSQSALHNTEQDAICCAAATLARQIQSS